MTLAPMLFSGPQFLSLSCLLSTSMRLARASLPPCSVFIPVPVPYQQKITLSQIRRRCVLTHTMLNLHPLHPVRPELCPLRPLRPELRPMCPELSPLRPMCPVRPELHGNAPSNSMRPEFPRNACSHPMPPRSCCELLCVRMGGFFIAGS